MNYQFEILIRLKNGETKEIKNAHGYFTDNPAFGVIVGNKKILFPYDTIENIEVVDKTEYPFEKGVQ